MTCSKTGSVNFDHLVKGMSVKLLHCKVISCVISKYFIGGTLRLFNTFFFYQMFNLLIYLNHCVFMESHYSCAQFVLDLTSGKPFILTSLLFFLSPSFFEHFIFLSDILDFPYPSFEIHHFSEEPGSFLVEISI